MSLLLGKDESSSNPKDDTPAATARGRGATKLKAELGAYIRAMRREQAIRFGIVMVSRCAIAVVYVVKCGCW